MNTLLHCPLCHADMHEAPLGPVMIDICGSCGARWFDRTELAAAATHIIPGAKVKFGSAVTGDAKPFVACPREGVSKLLVPYVAYGCGFKRCPGCRGVLFTGEEWGALEAAFRVREERDPEGVGLLDFLVFIGDIGSIILL